MLSTTIRTEPAANHAALRHRLPRSTSDTAPASSRKPTSPFAPEQAEAICTRNPCSPCGMMNEVSSPWTASASGTNDRMIRTAPAVRSLRWSSSDWTAQRDGMGHARNRKATATLVRHSIRTPNSSVTTPATKNGMVSRSIRHSQ